MIIAGYWHPREVTSPRQRFPEPLRQAVRLRTATINRAEAAVGRVPNELGDRVQIRVAVCGRRITPGLRYLMPVTVLLMMLAIALAAALRVQTAGAESLPDLPRPN